ncbi:MAG TPA: hypothetical protein ACFYEK_10965 [Candidatus Wunengus sp. YC60]|uniref:hypothetical protein n=1 Tax=Candidatus Wunengus sp. YC60 TaxID=3367697 RepID=UPI004026674F
MMDSNINIDRTLLFKIIMKLIELYENKGEQPAKDALQFGMRSDTTSSLTGVTPNDFGGVTNG